MFERLCNHGARFVLAVLGLALLAGSIVGHGDLWLAQARLLATSPVWIPGVLALVVGLVLARWRLTPGAALARVPPWAFAATTFAVALASGVWAHYKIHKGVPDVPDELGYLHQARTFADGYLAAPSPPAREFFYVSWGVHDRDQWYAVFPPGYGVLLAGGQLLGAPHLVNPVLGALLALVIWALAKHVFAGDGVPARLAVLLYLGSWFRLMNTGSFMSHPAAALLAAVAVLATWRGVIQAPARRGAFWACAAGISLAYLGATRQLDAIVIAVALVPAVTWALWRRPGATVRRLALAALCGLPLVAAYLGYNHALTGSALLPPQQRYMMLKEKQGDCFRLGFGPGVGECPITQGAHFGKEGFAPRHAAHNTQLRLAAWLAYTFAWAPLAMLPVLAMGFGAWRGGAEARRRALFAAIFATTIGLYALFFYHGVAYGARFYFVAFPFVAILAAAGWTDAGEGLARRWPRARSAVAAFGLALFALAGASMVASWPAVDAHAGKRSRTGDGRQVAALQAPGLEHVLIFVDSMVIPAAVTEHPAELGRSRPLVVKDLGDAANAGFARLHPELTPMRMQGTRLVPLSYSATAPMRHEGGAMYPLERSSGGFGDRATANDTRGLALSGGEALRFTASGPARFALPLWVLREDAGAMNVALQLVSHPRSPPIALALDGHELAPTIATASSTWELRIREFPGELGEGLHWLEVHLPQARAGDALFIDYVELRRRQ
jgi:hypothetical protein